MANFVAMRLAGVAVLFAVIAAGVGSPASAAIFIRLATTIAHRGGVVRLVGDAAAMPLYALPVAKMPSCMRYGTCAGPMRSAESPKRPFVFIGRTPGIPARMKPVHAFAVRLSRALSRGRYKVFVWCRVCGGTLIVAGSDLDGQTLRVVR